ncbi:CBL-interacting protein kinase 2 [Tanacetum coccineum]
MKVTKREAGLLELEAVEEGRKGILSIDAEIFELPQSFHLVEVKKCNGDTLEYQNVVEHLRPRLQEIAWDEQKREHQEELLRAETQTQNADSKNFDVSRDEMEVCSVETRTQNEDSKTTDISSNLIIESAKFESVNSRTQENEDTKIAAAMSYDFKTDSSQINKDSSHDGSFRHDAFQCVNSRVHDEDSTTNAAVSSNLNRESSFKDDSEILAIKSRVQNNDSETTDVSSNLRSYSLLRNDAKAQSMNSRK